MKKTVVLMIALLVIAMAASAGPKKVTLPAYDDHTLENGIILKTMVTKEVPLVTLRLVIPVGSVHDGGGKDGIANLTARLLMKGAAGIMADEIAETIESVGGRLEAFATKDYTVVYGEFMSKDFGLALDLLGKVVMSPDFTQEELDREKSLIDSEIQGVKESPSRFTTREYTRFLVGDHPYARPVAGSREAVAAITREDVAAFHKEHYVADGCIFAIVGDIDSKKAVKAVKKALGGWKGKRESAPAPKLEMGQASGRSVIVIDKKDATQSQIRIGNIAVPRNNPHFFPLEVGNSTLGGGFTSRLMDEIRVNRGLSYGASSYLTMMLSGGAFTVSTFTKNQSLRETIDVALAEVEKIRTEPIGDEELGNTKKYISGLFPFELETNGSLARWLTELSFYGLEKGFVENYRQEIDKVTSKDILDVAGKYFQKDNCLIVLLTNYEEVKDQLEGLGEVKVVSIDELK
jgi:zinc protease